jgi:hypothetical protein
MYAKAAALRQESPSVNLHGDGEPDISNGRR